MTRLRDIPSLLGLTWRLPAVLAGLAIVISIALAVVFDVTQIPLLLAILGLSFAVVFSAMFVVVGLAVLSEPWIWSGIERGFNRLLEIVFRLPAVSTGKEGLIGSRGIVIEDFRASENEPAKGRIRVAGESWAAIAVSSGSQLVIGQEVIIREVRGLVLFVEPSPARGLAL
jgi:membrane protein implicated in regulation of membrane protease activity